MSMPTRRAIMFVVLSLLVLTAVGSLIFWVVYSRIPRNGLSEANQVASIALPAEPSLLAWSADGSYLAAGTGYTSSTWVQGPGKVFIVDVGKEAVAATLDTVEGVDGLAFSPDSKWLAVATRMTLDAANGQAELVVFAVPEFTAKLKAKSELRRSEGAEREFPGRLLPGQFVDIAWAADGKSLHAIDGGTIVAPKTRRWTAPGFIEQPGISDPDQYTALAVAPDGLTLALVASRGMGPGVLHLFDLEKGTKLASIKDLPYAPLGNYRAAFTADGKTVGVFAGAEVPFVFGALDPAGKQKRKEQHMSWWEVATGKPASPVTPRFAVPPAAKAQVRDYSISPDGRIWAHALVFRDLNDPKFPNIVLTQTDAAKNWNWHVGAGDYGPRPSLAFSPDGTKLAGTLETPAGWTIAIWAVP